MYLNNLTTNLAYEVRVRAGTRSHVGAGKLHLGDWSPVSAVFLQPGCENMKVGKDNTQNQEKNRFTSILNKHRHATNKNRNTHTNTHTYTLEINIH